MDGAADAASAGGAADEPPALTADALLALVTRVALAAASRLDPVDLARTTLDALLGPLGADGGTIYRVEGDALVELCSLGDRQQPPPPPRLPLSGSFNATLLASPGARQWTPEQAPPAAREALGHFGPLTVASAGIASGTRRLGLMHLTRRRHQPYRDLELTLLATVAAQLGPALELGPAGAVGGAGGRELSVLHRITAAAGRALELPAVARSCVELTRELTGADVVSVHLVDEDGEQATLAAGTVIGAPGELSSLPAAGLRQLAQTPRAVVLPVDLVEEPYRSACRAAGLQLTVVLPLLAGGTFLGVVSMGFRTPRQLGQDTLDTLVAMAEQQALAIDCARGQQLTRLQARLSSVVREVAERALAATGDASTFDALLDGTLALCGGSAARLALIDERGGLTSERERDLPPALAELPPLPADDPFLLRVRAASGPMVYDVPERLDSGTPWAEAFRAAGMFSLVVLPLRLRGELIGVLASHAAGRRRFHREELAAMSLMSSVAASAVEGRRQRRLNEQQRQRLGQILEHLPLPVMVLDAGERFEQLNAAYRELNPAAALGTTWSEGALGLELRSPTGAPVPLAQMAVTRALAGEPRASSDLRVRLGGSWRHMVTHASVLRDEHGHTAGLVAAVQDVTALRELADAKDRFLDIASHELRSPLSALRACTSLLDLDPTVLVDEGRRRQLTTRILHQVDRLVLLLDELVEMARIRGGTLRLSRGRMDLAEVAREVAELSQLQSDRHRIQVLAPAPVEGLWDRQRVAQVLTNLVSNAARYSPDGGDIVIQVGVQGASAVLSVEDHGIGIAPEEQGRLFEPYYRGPGAGQVARGGLGLGLHITMEIVRHHQGRIDVESQPGRGSRFTVRLPREAS